MDLKALDQALEISGGRLGLTSNTLPGSPLGLLLRQFNADRPLAILDAAKRSQGSAVTVTGKAEFLGARTPVTAVFGVDAKGAPQVSLRFALNESETPWKFSTSFPGLPPFLYGADEIFDLDRLGLSDHAFVLATRPGRDEKTGADLAAGLSFAASCKPAALLGSFQAALAGGGALTLAGSIVAPVPNQSPPALPLGSYPWQSAAPVPGIMLAASLGGARSVGKLELADFGLRLYAPPSREWLAANPSYVPVLGVVGRMQVPSAGIAADLSALFVPSSPRLLLESAFAGVRLENLAKLADLANGGDLFDLLPTDLKKFSESLGGIELLHAGISLNGGLASNAVDYVHLAVGVPKIQWTPWKGFTLSGISADFMVVEPFGSGRAASVVLRGGMSVAGTSFDAATEFPGFDLRLALAEQASLPLAAFFRQYLPALPAPADLSVDDAEICISPGKEYSLRAHMADRPPWTLSLGPSTVAISNVALELVQPAGGAAQGGFSGMLDLGAGMRLQFIYEIPGSFELRADLPRISLTQLIGKLSNQALALPGGFDLDFENSSVRIGKAGEDCLFLLGTQLQGFGGLAFEARKVSGGQWGFAVGIDLSSGKASTLPALAPLSLFESLFGLRKLMLVVSSFNDAGFAFPDMARFDDAHIAGTKLALPGAGGVSAGLNLYGEWVVDPSDKRQNLLKSLLGLDASLGVTLQIGADPARDARLYVSYNARIQGHPLVCRFGGQLKDGSIGLFLDGQMTVSIQGQDQTFAVTLLFVANGAFLSATAKSSAPIAIGFDGIKVCKLANLALVIGADWEGVPSLGVAGTIAVDRFESSIAVFFDSAEPAKSMIAGSLSDLSLKDIVDTLTGNVIPSQIDGFLDRVAVKGTQPFTIPGELGADLDNLKLDSIAAAFAAHGVQIPSSVQEVFLVVDRPGSRWYLTDLRNRARHYRLVKDGADIRASVEAQLYCVPQRTTIGALPPFDRGFFVNGAIGFFGFDASATIDISPNQGIAIDGQMDKLVIGTESLFSLRAAQGDGGPRVSVATFTRASDPDPQLRPPHFYVNGHMKMLGASRDIYARLSTNGLEFDLKGNLLPAVDFDLHGTVGGPGYLGVGGALRVGVGTLDLGPLGKIDIGTGVDGKLDIRARDKSISASLQGRFQFAGQGFDIPRINLDVSGDAFVGLASALYDTVKKILLDFLLDAAKWAEYIGRGFITGVTDMASVLQGTFKASAEDAARFMRAAGRTAQQVGDGLKSVYKLSADAAGAVLKGAGYAVNEVASGLYSAYGLSAEAAAVVLKGLGYGANEIGSALKTFYGLSGDAAATVLKGLGFGADAVAGALKSVYKLSADAVSSALNAAGYAASEAGSAIGNFFKSVGNALDPTKW